MTDLMEAVTSLAKRRGIAFQSAEIYGGLRSSWDYGPLGVELRRNIRNAWWRANVQLRDDVVGVEAAIITSPRVWQASGHLETFHDPLVECTNCHQRFREDHLEANADGVVLCPNCGGAEFTEPKQFNLMLKTFLGPIEDDDAVAYLRPETAQGMFVNFPAIQAVSRKKLPFGIAQIGKSFRNEITPGNFIFRTREFEQMEMEFFVEPGTDDEWFEHWVERRMQWYLDLGVSEDKLRLRPHEPDELAHYAKAATDVEYEFPFGWQELEGIANRTDYDLKAHQDASGEDLTYFDQERETRYHPFVIEPAVGVDRMLLTFLLDAYRVEEVPDRQGRHRQAHRAGAASRPRADQGRRAAAVAQREARPRGPPRARPGQARVDDPVRRRGRDRAPLPAPGRGRHAVLRDGRLRLARRRPGDGARARLDAAGPHRDRRPRRRTCGSGCERRARAGLAPRLDGRLRGRVRGHARGRRAARARRARVPARDRPAVGLDRACRPAPSCWPW